MASGSSIHVGLHRLDVIFLPVTGLQLEIKQIFNLTIETTYFKFQTAQAV